MLTFEDAQKLRQMLELHEGKRNHLYVDTVGKATIGIGRNIEDIGVSDDEIRLMLENDIERAAAGLKKSLPWVVDLDPVRYCVLLDMAFNMGIYRFLQFKQTLAAVKQGNYDQAASQMLQSKWAGQVGKRAIRLSTMMRKGNWYDEEKA